MANQNNSTSEALDLVLYDIELPVSPDFNWLSLLQTSAYWLVIVVCVFALIALVVMFKARNQPFAKQSLFLHFLIARSQLSKLQTLAQKSQSQTGISQAEVHGFYHLAQRLIYVSQRLKVEDEPSMDLLQRQVNFVVFSEHTVSRETFAMNLKEVETFLQNHLSVKNLWAYYLSYLKTPFKGDV
ncbi:hypothetical protein [Thiomicrorhabdus sp. Kp2]|uniref:hypothetical protein n=1 Tax=Thiomicrorhabdus sp. Kp2 TaxID=1123518 RepID=UPI000423CDD9|nr:hypothetical protein [Thiomicrorhabdus sp. Kp2]